MDKIYSFEDGHVITGALDAQGLKAAEAEHGPLMFMRWKGQVYVPDARIWRKRNEDVYI